MTDYLHPRRPDWPCAPDAAVPLAGGGAVSPMQRSVPASESPRVRAHPPTPASVLVGWTAPRAAIAGLPLDRPRIMGIPEHHTR